MKNVIVLAALWASANAWAQQPDPGCQVANAVLGALFNGRGSIPCGPPAQAGPQTPATQSESPPVAPRFTTTNKELDTPENLAAIVNSIRNRYSKLDPAKASFWSISDRLEFCSKELQPFSRYRDILNSGYDELNRKCKDQAELLEREFSQQVVAAAKQAKEADERENAAAEIAQKKKEAEQRAAVSAELRSGKRVPTDCAEFMVSKGYDNPDLLKASVMVAAYQAPKGFGVFFGKVVQIDGESFILSGEIPPIYKLVFSPPANSILIVGRDARVINGQEIQVGALVRGYAAQTGTRNVRLVNGSNSTIAVMRAVCVSP